jgi:hypothetical protein
MNKLLIEIQRVLTIFGSILICSTYFNSYLINGKKKKNIKIV